MQTLSRSPGSIIDTVLTANQRVLLFGEPGVGKSTLAADLARALQTSGRRCFCLSADPGSPAFGVPGAISLGEWLNEAWDVTDVEAMCSLDAARFRLPLISALRRLAELSSSAPLLVDPPGVVRGVAGAELLISIVEAAHIDVVLTLVREGETPPLQSELQSLKAKVFITQAAKEARHPTKRARTRYRTQLWNTYLHKAEKQDIEFGSVQIIGTAPPIDAHEAWTGRQVALLDEHHATLALGEVVAAKKGVLRIKIPRTIKPASLLLVRDANRTDDGWLNTVKPRGPVNVRYVPPPDITPSPGYAHVVGPRPVARVGPVDVILVNGIFGDPLLHLRLRRHKRSLLFDLGEASRLPARIAHQVSDVFISHTHIDHIGGFLWLLRSRIGFFPTCRMFGPPGLIENIKGLIRGILWDRIGDRGPIFEVAELHDERLIRSRIEVGRQSDDRLTDQKVADGVVLEEADFRVRAVTLDHGTPALSFAFEPSRGLNIRKDRLTALGLSPGPWLDDLKRRLNKGEDKAMIKMPDGGVKPAGELADELVLISPGKKLVYATDLADTKENRERLVELAKGAHTFFCEAAFIEKEAAMAESTQHLTARACGEIANIADVERLVPFHFSKRYEHEPELIYREAQEVCSQVVEPKLP